MNPQPAKTPAQNKDQELQRIFNAYQASKHRAEHPGIFRLFGRVVRETITPGYQSPDCAAMVQYADRIRKMLDYGTLLRLVPADQSPPVEVVLGRNRGEYSVAEVKGVSIFCNGQDGEYVSSDQFIDLSQFKALRIVDTRYGRRIRIL